MSYAYEITDSGEPFNPYEIQESKKISSNFL